MQPESYRTGALNVFKGVNGPGFKILIPWINTRDNPCGECQALDGELFEPDDFPPPPHFRCQCNDPMANPILIS